VSNKPTRAICIFPFTLEVTERAGNLYRFSVATGTIADLKDGKWKIWCGDVSDKMKQYFRPLPEW